MKKHKLTSIEGIDVRLFECVYSPAKRRGPVPGRVSQVRKAAIENQSRKGSPFLARNSGVSVHELSNQNVLELSSIPAVNGTADTVASGATGLYPPDQATMLQHLENQNNLNAFLMKKDQEKVVAGGIEDALLAQQRQLVLQAQSQLNVNLNGLGGIGDPSVLGYFGSSLGNGGLGTNQQAQAQAIIQAQQHQFNRGQEIKSVSMTQPPEQSHPPNTSRPPSQRMKIDHNVVSDSDSDHIIKYLSLLNLNDPDGNLFRSYYMMSINQTFCLPVVRTNEEYNEKYRSPLINAQVPPADLAALNASRFSEIALGALIDNQATLALRLSNSTIICLRQCTEEIPNQDCMFDVAKAYFLHGVLRSLRADFTRYFKYRRICMNHIEHLKLCDEVNILLSAIAFHDAWVYMMFNASYENVPAMDLPKGPQPSCSSSATTKYGVSYDPASIATNPEYKAWIKGLPPVFLNNEAPHLSRCLDGLACAIRNCCEQANIQFDMMLSDTNMMASDGPKGQKPVTAHEDEFCSRNMINSAETLLHSHDASTDMINKNIAHRLIISAMNAFLVDGGNQELGFDDSQIHSILFVCNTVMERPILLHCGGPVYHMVSNATILLCHLLNEMHSKVLNSTCTDVEKALYEELLDTFVAIRKLLNMHRRKLPVKLRCHGIPRANGGTGSKILIDLQSTFMCRCRGCQAFILKSCSPCVAAERAKKNQMDEFDLAREFNGEDKDEIGKLLRLGDDSEFDEAMLSVLEGLVAK